MALSPGDPSSYARPDHVKTTHIHLGKHNFFLEYSTNMSIAMLLRLEKQTNILTTVPQILIKLSNLY